MQVERIKRMIEKLNGQNVVLVIKNGRKGYQKKIGVISGIYPDIFTVDTLNEDAQKKLCLSYIDVLTKNVRLYNEI